MQMIFPLRLWRRRMIYRANLCFQQMSVYDFLSVFVETYTCPLISCCVLPG